MKCKYCDLELIELHTQFDLYCPLCDDPKNLMTAVLLSETKEPMDAAFIAGVIKNRAMVLSKNWKSVVKKVIYQPNQFSGVPFIRKDGTRNKANSGFKTVAEAKSYYSISNFWLISELLLADQLKPHDCIAFHAKYQGKKLFPKPKSPYWDRLEPDEDLNRLAIETVFYKPMKG